MLQFSILGIRLSSRFHSLKILETFSLYNFFMLNFKEKCNVCRTRDFHNILYPFAIIKHLLMIMYKSGELEDRSVFLEILFKDLIKIFRNLNFSLNSGKTSPRVKHEKQEGEISLFLTVMVKKSVAFPSQSSGKGVCVFQSRNASRFKERGAEDNSREAEVFQEYLSL